MDFWARFGIVCGSLGAFIGVLTVVVRWIFMLAEILNTVKTLKLDLTELKEDVARMKAEGIVIQPQPDPVRHRRAG